VLRLAEPERVGEAVGEDCDVGASGEGIGLGEIAPRENANAERAKEARRDFSPAHHARALAGTDDEVRSIIALEIRKGCGAVPPILEGGVRCWRLLAGGWSLLLDFHQALGGGVRQLLDKSGLGHRKDRGGCAEAES